jgi:hypothetical protein
MGKNIKVSDELYEKLAAIADEQFPDQFTKPQQVLEYLCHLYCTVDPNLLDEAFDNDYNDN